MPWCCGEHGERVCADLVRGVAVRGDAVGAGDDQVDLAARHQRRRGAVGDHGVRDAGRLELPGGEPRALEQRPRLVDEHVLEQAALPGGAERADGRAVAAGREPAGVAVGERARAGREQLGGVRGHAPAALDLLAVERACARSGVGSVRICASAQTRLTAVGRDAASTRSASARSSPRERREREPVRRRDADRGRAAHRERADRLDQLGGGAALELDLLVRQAPLVEQDDARALGLDDPSGSSTMSLRRSVRSPRPTRRGTSPAPR